MKNQGTDRENNKNLFLVLDNIRSAHNVGSIFRTADAVGVSKIFLCGVTPTPDSAGSRAKKDISKTALGAENYIPWEHCRSTLRLVKKLKKENIRIIALEQAKGARKFNIFKPRYPMALILGNEVGGISRKVLAQAHDIIYIPMAGQKESLNVSVAAGIAVFELTRKH